jgi:hypothetical protein
MQMNGTLANLMAKTDPKLYRIYLVNKKREESAIYVYRRSVLLFYQKLVSELKSMGFVVNPYVSCIANKIVDGHQLTLRLHVDDLMISHGYMSAINDFLRELKVIYGDSLTESTGKQHNYLGMIFDFSSKNEVQINMNLYISKIINKFPEKIIGKTSTPAGDHLLKINIGDSQLCFLRFDSIRTQPCACWMAALTITGKPTRFYNRIYKGMAFLFVN